MDPLSAQLAAATDKAMIELSGKKIEMIQYETAITWAGRALASYARLAETGDLQRLLDAEEYGHEALEHAALADPSLCSVIRLHLVDAKERAMRARNPL
jgi:hypothetical protein